MKFIYRIAAVLLCAALVFTAAACDSSGDRRIYFELSEIPSTLDPQTASTVSELMIVRNLFEGLVRCSSSGEIIPGVAERYEQNGLEYTFYLRKNACWYTGDKLTADDFVFGLRRAVSPDTRSPFASRLSAVSGAEAILSGKAPTDSLGVTAVNDHTLRITLIREDADFLKTLSDALCMPCNEKFFNECIGKYGLEKKYVMANGSYYLAKWNQTDFGIRIYKNAVYHGNFTAKNGGVFFSKNEKSSPKSILTSETADAAFVKGDDVPALEKSGFKVASVENICWILTISRDYSNEMCSALAQLINREKLTSSRQNSFRAADSLFPAVLNINDASGAGILQYNPDAGKEQFSSAVKKTADKKFPRTVLYYADDTVAAGIITDMIGHWQQTLSAFINMEAAKNPTALSGQIKERTLQMAVFPITAQSDSVKEYMSVFSENTSVSPADMQRQLLNDSHIIPLFFEKTCIAASPALSGLSIDNLGGYVDFSVIEKAK